MAINKVIYGDTTLIDLTEDTVTRSDLIVGKTAHNAAGEQIQGARVEIPQVTTSFIYDGTQKESITTYDSDHINITGTSSATIFGNYTYTLALKDKTNYMWADGTTADRTINWSINVKIVTWASGTDSEISTMLSAHYADFINIYDYWAVGDTRSVSLSAMEATGVGESHVAQTVTMVLVDKGDNATDISLTTSINGHKKPAFIVGQKNVLSNGTTEEPGYYNSGTGVSFGYIGWARFTWCDNVYRNSMPSDLKDLFKRFRCVFSTPSNATTSANCYFAIPKVKHITGGYTYAPTENGVQLEYYKTTANRAKYIGDNSTTQSEYMTSTPKKDDNNRACCLYSSGQATHTNLYATKGIAPFGVI